MTTSTSFVFKLHYDDGPIHVSRRYGYTGKINMPAVYSGLFDRTAQVLHLSPGTFTLALRDSLGNPSIKLDTFQDFLNHVCQPLIENPHSVKIDEKGRRVLVFIVEKKEKKKEEAPKKPLTCSLPPPIKPASRSVQTDSPQSTNKNNKDSLVDSSPLSIGGKTGIDQLSKRFEPIQPRVSKPGYHAAYSTTSTTSSTDSSSSSSTTQEPVASVKQDKKESWGTVRGMLEGFVKDLNVHLADTFGDEAGSFRLNTEDNKKKEVEIEVEEPKTPFQEPKALHPHVFCDRCLKTICGSRFKCRSCSNYDLCESCVDFRTQFHPGAHTFSEIVRPGATPLPSIRGRVEVERPSTVSRLPPRLSVPNTATVPSPPATPVAHPPVHNATCDICQTTIIGTRMKCVNCPDWDVCSKCYSNTTSLSSIHPNHNFVSIHHPRDFHWHPRISSTPIHHHIRCDGCNKSPIKGIRYKCTSLEPGCQDFDLCQDCEADPIPRHPVDHVLLKIRQPVKSIFGVPTGGGGFQDTVRRAQEMSQRLTGSGGGGSAQAQAHLSNPIASLISSIGAVVQGHASPSPTVKSSSVASTPSTTDNEKVETTSVETRVEEKTEIEVKAESESEDEEDEKVEGVVAKEKEEEKVFGCVYVADISFPDGSIVPAGSEFCKMWKVRNNGTLPWKSVKLVNVGGFSAAAQQGGIEVGDLEVGEETEVSFECKAPEEEGRFMSFFRLEDREGNKFGDRFWLDITVQSEGMIQTSTSSMNSSSIITPPSLNAGGQAASVPATTSHTPTTTSVAPSTTFSLSEGLEEGLSDFESVSRQNSEYPRSASEDEEEMEDSISESESEESSELEEDSEDEFVVLSDGEQEDGWRSQH